ncbi:MAG TPA: shikimate kinase [Bacteroidales bacterium]|nr:shikimate kinase [Bacteroidales bacterium]
MRIYLVGFMGSGKSSLGRRIARKLNYRFIDLDTEVERIAGQSIAEIFEQMGEMHFRKLESEALRKTIEISPAVIATGGGTPCYFDNMDFINRNGTSVYLRLSPQSLAWRLENAQKKRPLVLNCIGEDLLQYIEQKLREREPCYMQSACIVKGETVRVDQVISLVFGT